MDFLRQGVENQFKWITIHLSAQPFQGSLFNCQQVNHAACCTGLHGTNSNLSATKGISEKWTQTAPVADSFVRDVNLWYDQQYVKQIAISFIIEFTKYENMKKVDTQFPYWTKDGTQVINVIIIKVIIAWISVATFLL